ncbi:SOS response-associated peptidase [Magnetospirillum sulfuroxidans]|uniref:Abasic site processing protein n=1 Tax=Magnetospirillum sulfuroxidans TaxID=611300 RepID=A0ABS5I762_9PROT|nr:SOS response-associated peptidase family protein [Magnetospirillum sulfuroxidans]MBR9970159.1 SOS response-associated peptidase family protein [Magnetospirillum sulfuroxidans]
MCSRFELKAPAGDIAARFGLTVPPPWPNATEFRPTDLALAIGVDGPALLRWGLRVEWDNRPLINARVESIEQKPTFRRLLANRVLIPASAWWEWNADKVKMRLAADTGGMMAFAALRDDDAFVILTAAATAEVRAVHHRMPVLAGADWLDGGAAPAMDRKIVVAVDQPPSRQGSLFD